MRPQLRISSPGHRCRGAYRAHYGHLEAPRGLDALLELLGTSAPAANGDDAITCLDLLAVVRGVPLRDDSLRQALDQQGGANGQPGDVDTERLLGLPAPLHCNGHLLRAPDQQLQRTLLDQGILHLLRITLDAIDLHNEVIGLHLQRRLDSLVVDLERPCRDGCQEDPGCVLDVDVQAQLLPGRALDVDCQFGGGARGVVLPVHLDLKPQVSRDPLSGLL
mmetsp:Transcript_103762/g.288926  ORF Transcript_103762/g.288926 Transcript_103762/m.288926 type:complete len:220 (+) Transcript_103762:124-783(+)